MTRKTDIFRHALVGRRVGLSPQAYQLHLVGELQTALIMLSRGLPGPPGMENRVTMMTLIESLHAGHREAVLAGLDLLADKVSSVPNAEVALGAIVRLRNAVVHDNQAVVTRPVRLSRRTRCATDLALRLLSPIHRQRYREEWAAELADLPRPDQAPYALRLVFHAWSLRRELSDKPRRNPRNGLIVVGVVIPSADAVAALCGLDWPAAVVGIGWTLGLMWVVSSKERTRNVVILIREARTSKAPIQK